MTNICSLFDKYRDGELGDAGRIRFESHLATCEDCRTRMALLNNLVFVLRQENIQPVDLADRIARRAFSQTSSWDALVASLFRPRFAVAAVGLMFALCSFFWLAPQTQQKVSYTEYETLLNQAESSNLAGKLLGKNDSELVMQLVQGGNIQ